MELRNIAQNFLHCTDSTFKKLYYGMQSHHLMKDKEKVEAVTDFIFLGSKIIADDDYSHETKRYLLFGRKLWQT